MNKHMTNSRLLVTIGLLTVCSSVQAQSPFAQPEQFPSGLDVRQVAYRVASHESDTHSGSGLGDSVLRVHDDSGEHLEIFDAEVLPADCGYSCPAAWTSELEAFYLNREGDDRVSASSAFLLSDFDYEAGVRVTVHRHLDCLDGWDITYAGGFDWSEGGTRSGAGFNPLFNVAGGINVSSFTNAVQHSQALRSRLHSLELNRKWYGWDVLAVGVGLRYLNVEEDYQLASIDAGGNSGFFGVETNNHAGGMQLLLEMKVPIGNWTTKARAKGGVFMNAADANTLLTNAGAVELANSDDDIEFASLIEFGYFLRYRLTQNISIQAGYEFWWVYGLAVAPDQLQATVTPRTGLDVDGNGDTWYHGGTAGIELVY